ncbi:hypothetical protein EFT87_04080 [Schleiferilactobacillus harbinensis]|uniref:hypothetical protein n=1 Tax=Schleiferilactobacillus harbinensis TaxID=304207 RepID=UPI0021A29F1A|nr:hypothetical protein [Schleiferilactobacillus harbinensis]MCT2907838.1 hypothetical protein [Schleiferilactobacillus harbinensis]
MENKVERNNMTIMGPSGLATINNGEVICVDHFRIENHAPLEDATINGGEVQSVDHFRMGSY